MIYNLVRTARFCKQ